MESLNSKNRVNYLLKKLDCAIIKIFGDFNKLEEEYRQKRNQTFPFTEIPFFVKENIPLLNSYTRYARSELLIKKQFKVLYNDDEFQYLFQEEPKEVRWYEQTRMPFRNVWLQDEHFSLHTYNTSISKTIHKILELPEDDPLRQILENLLFSEPFKQLELIQFIFSNVALYFPLEYLDLVMRLTLNLELFPGTFNFFLFAALYDLIRDLNLDDAEATNESRLEDFVSDLKAYAKSEEILNEKNPKLQEIFKCGLGNDTVINQALDLSNLTTRCYALMNLDTSDETENL